MTFRRVFIIILASFAVSLVSYFLFSRFLFRPGGKAALSVNSAIGSLNVALNGEILGKTSYFSDSLKPGDADLTLSQADNSYKARITLTGGALTVVNYSLGPSEAFSEGEFIWLTPSSDTGSLLVISSPDGVDVQLDNTRIGQTPLSYKGVAVGNHTLTLSKDGYRSHTVKFHVQPSYKLNIKVNLFILPYVSGGGKISFPSEARFNIYDLSTDNPALYADTSAWAKGVVFYAASMDKDSSPSASPYDFFIDDQGFTFDKAGTKVSLPTVSDQNSVKIGYLGRVSDQGLTAAASQALSSLAQKLLPQVAKVQVLPTGLGYLKVRQGPSITTAEIGRVNVGDTPTLLSEDGSFYKIQLPDGTVGYISSTYAKKL
ncbi:MAG: PEGA domain-containing protein [Patescibacteria group bacterium]|nr:PEGA domain-containing protein [Patescibacteria group bacterium]